MQKAINEIIRHAAELAHQFNSSATVGDVKSILAKALETIDENLNRFPSVAANGENERAFFYQRHELSSSLSDEKIDPFGPACGSQSS